LTPVNYDEKFEILNQKLDGIVNSTLDDFSEVEEKPAQVEVNLEPLEAQVAEIKSTIDSQSQLLGNLRALENLNSLSKLEGLEPIQDDVKTILTKFDTKLQSLAQVQPETTSEAVDIKQDLENLKSELLESILSVFDQISFVVEAEDIKDFVAEKTDELKEFSTQQVGEIKEYVGEKIDSICIDIPNQCTGVQKADVEDIVETKAEEIKSALGSNFDDIISSLDTLHQNSADSSGNLFDIKQGIEEVKDHIASLQDTALLASVSSPENESNEDDDEDSYTLSDVETDIAKLRLSLKEIAEAQAKLTQEPETAESDNLNNLEYLDKLNNLDKMNEDLVSISTRTNKLLLNSDESYNALKSNIDDFKNVVSVLDEKVRYMDTTEVNRRIENKIENVNKMIQSSVKSDKIFNQALMYLAEWVDTASEDIGSISETVEKVSEIDEVKNAISEIKKGLPKYDEDKLLNTISERFESQQEHIERLESKIEKLSTKRTTKSGTVDVKEIVEEVVARFEASMPKEKANTKLAKKVDNIEKQLTMLNEGLQKLTSYVDE
ncbi:hypothetical protein KBA27_05955, partial [bacterium]|nr:hypothetical protein [bacterium]